MANIKSAAKRARQSVLKTVRNASIVTSLKTQQKKFHTTLKEGKKEAIRLALNSFFSSLDKAAKKGVIHKNSANRKKAAIVKCAAIALQK